MIVIAIANQKGGVGKTTTAANLSAGLAKAGRNVLAIDLDAQGHLTQHFGLVPDDLEHSIYDVLTKTTSFDIQLVTREIGPGLSLVPANTDMATIDVDLAGQPAYDLRLKRTLRDLSYDYILLDCPPNLGASSINAIVAADVCLVCVQPQTFSFRGVKKLLETVQEVGDLHDRDIVPYAVPTIYEKRLIVHRAVLDQIKEYFHPRCFSPIHKNAVIDQAQASGVSVIEYDNSCTGALDYTRLAREVINEFEKGQTDSVSARTN